MKRNFELIRNILIRLESFNSKEITDEALIYHLDLLIDSEHITGIRLKYGGLAYFLQLDYTEKGYELLTHIKDKTVWDSIKEKLHENGFTVNDVPVDIIKELSQEIRSGAV